MASIFRSKADTWLVVVLMVSMAIPMVGAFRFFSTASPESWWIAGVAVAVGTGFPLWILLTTDYRLDGRLLTVRCGPLKWHIPVDEIRRITPTSNPISSPALSLDRLRIDYGQGRSLMVSPRDKAGFLRAVEAARRPPA